MQVKIWHHKSHKWQNFSEPLLSSEVGFKDYLSWYSDLCQHENRFLGLMLI